MILQEKKRTQMHAGLITTMYDEYKLLVATILHRNCLNTIPLAD